MVYDTEFGRGWAVFDGDVLLELGLPGTAPPKGRRVEAAALPAPVASATTALERYWGGGPLPEPGDELIERASGTPFLEAVYRTVSAIPRGETMTYGEVAARVGRPGGARAVGAAMARNPYAPMIPCHRVVGSTGGLTGYGGGLDMKRRLLAMERGDG